MEVAGFVQDLSSKDPQHKQFPDLLGINFKHSELDIDIVLEGKEVGINLQGWLLFVCLFHGQGTIFEFGVGCIYSEQGWKLFILVWGWELQKIWWKEFPFEGGYMYPLHQETELFPSHSS